MAEKNGLKKIDIQRWDDSNALGEDTFICEFKVFRSKCLVIFPNPSIRSIHPQCIEIFLCLGQQGSRLIEKKIIFRHIHILARIDMNTDRINLSLFRKLCFFSFCMLGKSVPWRVTSGRIVYESIIAEVHLFWIARMQDCFFNVS